MRSGKLNIDLPERYRGSACRNSLARLQQKDLLGESVIYIRNEERADNCKPWHQSQVFFLENSRWDSPPKATVTQ